MRRTLLVLLIVSFGVGQFGPTAWVFVRQQQGRRRAESLRVGMREGNDVRGLTHLAIPIEDDVVGSPAFVRIGWKEVIFEGRLYDVIFEMRDGNTWHLWGFHDREEQAATAELASHLDRDSAVSAVDLMRIGFHLFHEWLGSGLRPRTIGADKLPLRTALLVPASFDDVPHPPPRG